MATHEKTRARASGGRPAHRRSAPRRCRRAWTIARDRRYARVPTTMPPAKHAKGDGSSRGRKGRRATNLGSLAAVVAAAAAAACLAPRGATAQFLSVPDTFLSSTDPSAPCPVDVDNLRLDPGLGEACDPGVQGDNLCDACVCDIALRLAEAGYRITGPDAVPFRACALQNLLALQQRGGLSIGGMMEVSRRCTSRPGVHTQDIGRLFRPARRNPRAARRPRPRRSSSTTTTTTERDAEADRPLDVDCEGQGCVLAGLVAAAPLASPTLRPEKSSPNLSSPPPDVFAASIAAPVVLGCFLIWVVAFCVGRERRRARLAAAFGGRCRSGEAPVSRGTPRLGRPPVSPGSVVRFDDVVVVAGSGGRAREVLLDGFSTASPERAAAGAPRFGRPQRRRQEHPPQRRRRPSGPRPRCARRAASSLWTTFRRGPGACPGGSPTYLSTTPTSHRTSPCSRR